MKKHFKIIASLAILVFLFPQTKLHSQTRLGVLEIPKGGVYQMLEDTLIVDELILRDSATLLLDLKSSSSYIQAKRITVGAGSITGKIPEGAHGQNGKHAGSVSGVCKDGLVGGNASNGAVGGPGKNLTIVAEQLIIAESFHIYLNGGNGGDGGDGGSGSGGSQSSAHCKSHGGDGGNGGDGSNGGDGGTLQLTYDTGIPLAEFFAKSTLHNLGGYHGIGGEGGRGGLRGHGASEQFSKHGAKGKNGINGKNGKEGKALFYSVKRTSEK